MSDHIDSPTQTTAADPAPTATTTPAAPPASPQRSRLAQQAYELASPVVERAKATLPAELIDRLEKTASAASLYSHQLLETSAQLLESSRKTPDLLVKEVHKRVVDSEEFVKSKMTEGQEFVKTSVTKGQEFVKTKVAEGNELAHRYHVPTSLAELQKLGAEQYANLTAAVAKLRASLPASLSDIKLPEEQVAQIRASINKVVEALPKLPTLELPKIDFSKYNTQELVKFGHKILDQVTPYLAPYQERVQKLLTDYKVPERAAEFQTQALAAYKKYQVDKVVPVFVNKLVIGETAAPVVAAQ